MPSATTASSPAAAACAGFFLLLRPRGKSATSRESSLYRCTSARARTCRQLRPAMQKKRSSKLPHPPRAITSHGRNSCDACCTSTPSPAPAARHEAGRCRWSCWLSSPIPTSWKRSFGTWDCRRLHPPWHRQDPHPSNRFSCGSRHCVCIPASVASSLMSVPLQTMGKTMHAWFPHHHHPRSDRPRGVAGSLRESAREASARITSAVSSLPTRTLSLDRMTESSLRSLRERSTFEERITEECGAKGQLLGPSGELGRDSGRFGSHELGSPMWDKGR
jgi:hypothetical protein